jgi:hypothetical protein
MSTKVGPFRLDRRPAVAAEDHRVVEALQQAANHELVDASVLRHEHGK